MKCTLTALPSVAIAALLLARPLPAWAQAPATFNRDVAPILNAKCVSCHRPGEAAPMALRTYDEARPFARAIRSHVVARTMPPWPADRSVGRFVNDPSLSDAQIATIASWVDGGAVQGDAKDLPPAPVFTTGWQLGEPDFVMELPEQTIPATGSDIFPIPRVTVKLDADRWIRAVEVRPGNRAVAHHAVLFSGAGAGAFTAAADVLGVWAVGTPPNVYPQGMGRWLRNGQVISANLHYHPNGTATTDRTRIGFYFGKGDLQKEVSTATAGDIVFSIPPGANSHEVRGVYVADQDITLVSLFPHMHLRGKDMRMTATYPDGRREVLLNVPAYDFNWQLFYYPAAPIAIPRGTRIDVVARFDNSAGNRRNPDATKPVTFGETTADEMMFGAFEFTANEGVSPRRPNDRAKFDVVMAGYPAGSAWVLTGPTVLGAIPSGLYLPRTGEGTWYLRVPPGMLVAVPAKDIAWTGNDFKFSAEARVSILGGSMQVNGRVRDDGTISATLQMTGTGLVPFRSFVGSRPGGPPAADEGGALMTNKVDGQNYVWVPPGVNMSKGFWLGQTEVLQTAFAKVMRASSAAVKNELMPAERIKLADAAAYCSAVGGRLPTPDEWEYARSKPPNPVAQEALDRSAWTPSNSGNRVHEVATRFPNRWSLNDMVGNLAEWTSAGTLHGELSFRGPASADADYAGFRCVLP